MNYSSLYYNFILNNQFDCVEPLLNGTKDRVLVFSSGESVYNCLAWLEGDSPAAGYVLINNKKNTSHMVLMNNTRNLLAIHYNELGWYESYRPVPAKKGSGVNLMLCTCRYTLFVLLPEKQFSIGKFTLQHYVVVRLPHRQEVEKPIATLAEMAENKATETASLVKEENKLKEPAPEQATDPGREAISKLLNQAENEGQVIVHCTYRSNGDNMRIWNTTYLTDLGSTHRSRLLHAENITFYPEWMPVPKGKTVTFTLIFSRLPKSCTSFNLIEEIPEPGGFFIPDIKRNKADVYQVNIH